MAREGDLSAEVTLAEAAAWLVRLRSDRTPETDAAFKEWLRHPAHARAFGRATDTWDIIPGAARLRKGRPGLAIKGHRRSHRRLSSVKPLMAASLAVAVLGAGLAAFIMRNPVYATKAGQEQTITLGDGSRLALNTDSRLTVEYSAAERRVLLTQGEAMFEVAKNPKRPFIVRVGDEEVRALGTTFTVRKDDKKIAVVLVEGRVEVTRAGADPTKRVTVAVLTPGERLTVRSSADAAIDRPNVEAAVAWRQGEVMFDDTLLTDAVAELNRYGGTQVQIGNPSIASLHTSGVFQTHDQEEFVDAMAELYHLKVEHIGDTLILTR